jgi:hypothetical protein
MIELFGWRQSGLADKISPQRLPNLPLPDQFAATMLAGRRFLFLKFLRPGTLRIKGASYMSIEDRDSILL